MLDPWLSQQPAARLIRGTARQQWRLIAVNLASGVVEAFSEGATLAVIFLAVEVLSAPVGQAFNWASNPIVSRWPAAAAWLNGLPATQVFMSLLALALLLQALQSASRFLNLVSVSYFAARCRALVTARIHSQVLRWSYPCASGYKVGDLSDYAAQGPEALRIQVERSAGLVVGLLLSTTYLVVLVGLSPWLLLAAAVLALVIVLVQKRLLPRIRAGSRAVAQIQAAISARVTEDFQGLRLLHSSGQLEAADTQLQQRMGDLEQALRGQGRRLSVVQPLAGFLPVLAMVLIAALSLALFGGRSTGVLPSLVTFVLALQRLNVRLASIATTVNELADNSGRLERLNQILSPAGKQFRRLGGTPFTALERDIRFEGVGLRYAPELPPALSDVSFTLPKGRMLALVGPSGAGKSSIADLLTGLYEPTAGRILVDGVPLEQLELASWQQRLGVVSQDTFLFNATIAENIAFGTPGATPEQIAAACAAAQAAGFIEGLPQGYATLVGERGFRLSGGQRQRLSLARAILRDPELLILDEATSALDSQSERLVQEAIERFERNHTVLVIAHRLSTIVRADELLVLDGGQVVQRGRHNTLLAEAGLYGQLWRQQAEATLPVPS
ncbi:ABC transporter ATP-binding protein [Cyanobium sp. ATX 6A2]|nr:ABC transporter ATP-binding protein [Cyanobium sp. ATX 6A2]